MTAKPGIPANRRSVVLFHSMFTLSIIMLFNAAHGVHKEAIACILLISALGIPVKLHADYYKNTKRIY